MNRVKEVFRVRKETLEILVRRAILAHRDYRVKKEKRETLVHRDRRVSLARMGKLPLKALIIGLQKTNRK